MIFVIAADLLKCLIFKLITGEISSSIHLMSSTLCLHCSGVFIFALQFTQIICHCCFYSALLSTLEFRSRWHFCILATVFFAHISTQYSEGFCNSQSPQKCLHLCFWRLWTHQICTFHIKSIIFPAVYINVTLLWINVDLYEPNVPTGKIRGDGGRVTHWQAGPQAADRCLRPHQGRQFQLCNFGSWQDILQISGNRYFKQKDDPLLNIRRWFYASAHPDLS